ncbi:MAG TPA: DUF2442 domain-containing protein [Terriglobia bacterium]|nr:DUF2442 domain-containing protein [Terriglobia bacterium]
MHRIEEVRALNGFRLWLRYQDGVSGEVDLSDIAGRGVFEVWRDRRVFEAVRISESGALEWANELDLCSDALYLRLTGKTPEEVFPHSRAAQAHA